MKRTAIDDYQGPMTIGVDVSAYQGADINWSEVANGEAVFDERNVGPVRYAIVRSSDGLQTRRNSKPDPMAVRNLQGAHEAGLLVAVYHFVRAYHDAVAQAELVLEVIRMAGVPTAFVALDVEGRPDDPGTPDTRENRGAWWTPDDVEPVSTMEILTDLVEMRRHLQMHGQRSLIYSGATWHWYIAQRGLPIPDELAGLDFWTPYYTRGKVPRMPVGPVGTPWPWAEWRFWQFAGSRKLPGRVPGIPGNVDLNRFRGDEKALREWWLPTTIPPTAIPFDREEILELAKIAKPTDPAAARELLAAHYRLVKGC
jgi:GH25 family lysozyme M1 (1,4-beta-N-acetylmuramidase)